MTKEQEWAVSINAFPFAFRSKFTTHRLGLYRRSGMFTEGVHYERLDKALNENYNIVGIQVKIPSGSRYVYNIAKVIEILATERP